MGILTDIHRFIIIIDTNIFISQCSLVTLNQMRSYQFRSQFKIYISSYQEFRINNWSCFIVTWIISKIYIIKKHDPIHINNSNIYNSSHAYRKLSTHLTQKWKEIKSRYRRKFYWCPTCRISRLSEYKWEILKNNSKRMYNLFNTLN